MELGGANLIKAAYSLARSHREENLRAQFASMVMLAPFFTLLALEAELQRLYAEHGWEKQKEIGSCSARAPRKAVRVAPAGIFQDKIMAPKYSALG
jgi:hypothetical protein